MVITFHNVMISVVANSPKEAYTKLCDGLAKLGDAEWTTDTWRTEQQLSQGEKPRSTEELFPKPKGT